MTSGALDDDVIDITNLQMGLRMHNVGDFLPDSSRNWHLFTWNRYRTTLSAR